MKKIKIYFLGLIFLFTAVAFTKRELSKQLASVPIELLRLGYDSTDWQNVLYLGSGALGSEGGEPDKYTTEEEIKELTAVYSLTCPHTLMGNDKALEMGKKLISSEIVMDIAYKWAKPAILEQYKKTSEDHKERCIEILKYAQKYNKNFDYKKELKYFNSLKIDTVTWKIPYLKDTTSGWGEETLRYIKRRPTYYKYYGFAYEGPSGSTKYRKVEAWIFRQIHYKRMTQTRIDKWISILLKDLKEN